MKIKLNRSYKKLNKNSELTTVFVYAVSGTEEQLASFKEAMGDNFRESEDGQPLWFSTRCVGNDGSLIITSAGKVVPDMSKFDQAASLASQYGGNLGLELARIAAAQLMGLQPVVVTAPVTVEKEAAE